MPRPSGGNVLDVPVLVEVKAVVRFGGAVVVPVPLVVPGFEFELEEELVPAGFERRLTGLLLVDVWAGFSLGRLVRNAPRTFSSSCGSGVWAIAKPKRPSTAIQSIIFNFILATSPQRLLN